MVLKETPEAKREKDEIKQQLKVSPKPIASGNEQQKQKLIEAEDDEIPNVEDEGDIGEVEGSDSRVALKAVDV